MTAPRPARTTIRLTTGHPTTGRRSAPIPSRARARPPGGSSSAGCRSPNGPSSPTPSRAETVGGVLLLLATVAALVWANVWPHSYESVVDRTVGPSHPLHLDLSLGDWAKDGLLSVFFFVAGIELKRELVAGELRDRRAAALPVVAAVCGVAVPALVYTLVNSGSGGHHGGWAIPTATDIAFALGVLAVAGTHLPSALRAFLLTLAVVDDLIAILIIAIFFSHGIKLWALGLAFLGLVLFYALHRLRVHGWYLYLPLAVVIWALMHESGVHATVAGVAMGLLLRCTKDPGEAHSPAEHIEHLVRPFSAGFCVPVFALLSAGVTINAHALAACLHPCRTAGRAARAAGRQAGRGLRRQLADRPIHQGRAQPRAGVERPVRGLRARRHRLHRLAADQRAGLRGRSGPHPAGQGGGPGRLTDLRPDRGGPAAAAQSHLSAAVRAGGGRAAGAVRRSRPALIGRPSGRAPLRGGMI